MSPLGMARIGSLSLLEYVGVAKVNIGLMNVDQQKRDKATQYHQKTPWEASVKHGSAIPSHCGEHVSPGKFLKKDQCLL